MRLALVWFILLLKARICFYLLLHNLHHSYVFNLFYFAFLFFMEH